MAVARSEIRERLYEIENLLSVCFEPSRETSMVRTKIDEARLWLTEAREKLEEE